MYAIRVRANTALVKMNLHKVFSRSKGVQLKKESINYSLADYEHTFTVLKKVLRVAGIRLLESNDSTFKRSCWNIYFWFSLFNLVVAMVLETGFVFSILGEGGSLIPVFTMLPCVGNLILAIFKSYKLVYNHAVYENVVDELRGMWPNGEVGAEEGHIVTSATQQLNRVVKGYYWTNVVLMFIFTSPPLVNLALRAMGNNVPLVVIGYYLLPFDVYQRGVYEVLIVIQIWHCLLNLWCMMAGDLMFCVLLGHITMQFDLLAVRIRNFIIVSTDNQLIESYPLAANKTTENKNMKLFNQDSNYKRWMEHQKEMTQIVLRHQALIRLSLVIEKEFSFSLLLHFMNGSIIICFCGYCSIFVEKWNVMAYKTFLITAAIQIWLLCWFGQKLLDSSSGVPDALYNCGWYRSSKEVRSLVLIMMHRAQKVVRITTYGFSVISLTSYTALMKNAWSYFTLLLNIMD